MLFALGLGASITIAFALWPLMLGAFGGVMGVAFATFLSILISYAITNAVAPLVYYLVGGLVALMGGGAIIAYGSLKGGASPESVDTMADVMCEDEPVDSRDLNGNKLSGSTHKLLVTMPGKDKLSEESLDIKADLANRRSPERVRVDRQKSRAQIEKSFYEKYGTPLKGHSYWAPPSTRSDYQPPTVESFVNEGSNPNGSKFDDGIGIAASPCQI